MTTDVETRTLLFSDIEGSTRLLAMMGDDAYAELLGTHRVLVRQAVAAHRGTEHSTAGDGFFMIFGSAREGVAAAVDAQRALGAQVWPDGATVRVRMGLHAGEIGFSEGDAVGMAIHEAARIMATAHGGQVLVSAVVRQLVLGALPAGVSLRGLGRYRLKDLDDAVELFQACHPDLGAEFPPPRTADVVVDLPAYRTAFVGRDLQVAEVLSLLEEGRLVTLTGVGGSGKTRLALEIAVRDADRHPDGVFFVDLAPVADPDLVLGTIAGAVRMRGEGSDLAVMLVGYLSDRHCLIVVDNCEHVIDACADVIDLLLGQCPTIRVLATSREALRIDGEQSYQVPSLSVHDHSSEAVQLWVSRARAVKANFEITDANRVEVLSICQRLDGIPLAIELAAARVDHLSVTDIAQRLDDRFELLVGGRRRRAQRQQTLQAAMDWSWDLLAEPEQILLRRLAVFAGPFTLDAVEAVCGAEPTLTVLRSLVAKSLVTVDESDDATRYRLYETVRLYAQARLVEAGEAAQRRDAHRDWYLARAEETPIDELMTDRVWTARVADYGNHRAALDWSASQDRPDLLARLVLRTAGLWSASPGLLEEGGRWLTKVAEDERQPAGVRADAFSLLAWSAMMRGDYPSIRPLAERSLALDVSDRLAYGHALMMVGRADEAVEWAGRAGLRSTAGFYRTWAAAPRIGVDPRGALDAFEEIIAELDPGSDRWEVGGVFVGAALARLVLDDGAGALQAARSAREQWAGHERWGGSVFRFGEVLEAMALGLLGRSDEARGVLLEVTRAVLRDRYPIAGHDCLVALAYIAAREDDFVRAAALLEPVVTDGRLRMQPMYFFVGRFLYDLHQALAGVDVDPPLPSVAAYAARAQGITTGAVSPDPTTAARIEDALTEFTTGLSTPSR